MALASMESIRPGPPVFPFFAPQFPPNMASMAAAERFRFPLQPPFQFTPAMFHALHAGVGVVPQPLQPNVAPLPRMPPAPPAPITPVTPMAPMTPVPNLALTFSQEEVDMVLYGYTRGRSSDRYHGHALSGLNFGGDLTHGIDKILSNQRNSPDHAQNLSRRASSRSSNSSACSNGNGNGNTKSGIINNTSNLAGGKNPLGQQGQVQGQPQFEAVFQEDTKSPIPFWGRGLPNQAPSHNPAMLNGDLNPPDHLHNINSVNNHGTATNVMNSSNNHNNNGKSSRGCNVNNNNKNINNNNNNSSSISGGKTGGGMIPLDVAALELQDGLAIYQTHFAGIVHCGVFCTKTVISRGTRYGPFKGRVVHTSEIKTNDDNTCMWEVFQDGKLSHFIDGRGSLGNWMAYINCARYAQEQNLIAIQVEGEIWYETCKDIPQGTELLVWYGDCYLQFMGVPVALKEMADGGAQEEADTSEGFQCERCGKVFAYKYYRDKHLKYTRCVDQGDRKYPCHMCSRSFEKRDRLRIHILHVHEKHRPHKCLVCGKSFSQSSSLNKHMRVHSGERPYKCVYCNKAFTASSILRTHIRQHSGEKPFKCKHCGKAFASHAAHDSHVRRTHAKERLCTCNVCGKSFQQPYELKFHMGSHINQ